jgi:hypothetical protein
MVLYPWHISKLCLVWQGNDILYASIPCSMALQTQCGTYNLRTINKLIKYVKYSLTFKSTVIRIWLIKLSIYVLTLSSKLTEKILVSF